MVRTPRRLLHSLPCAGRSRYSAHWNLGRKHLCYIKEYRPALYTDLLTSGKLSSYLAEVDNRAKEMQDLLVQQMAEKQGITEQLKAQGQMTWVQQMNSIRIVII